MIDQHQNNITNSRNYKTVKTIPTTTTKQFSPQHQPDNTAFLRPHPLNNNIIDNNKTSNNRCYMTPFKYDDDHRDLLQSLKSLEMLGTPIQPLEEQLRKAATATFLASQRFLKMKQQQHRQDLQNLPLPDSDDGDDSSSFGSTSKVFSTMDTETNETADCRSSSPLLRNLVFPGSSLAHLDSSELDQVAVLFRRGALIGLTLYLCLLMTVYTLAPVSSFQSPASKDGGNLEQTAHFISFLLLFVTNGSRLVPLLLRENSYSLFQNGVIVGTLAVQCIAMTANLLMSVVPTPIVLDPHTGLRVHLVRWCEWTALAFLMTFLTVNLDAPMRQVQAQEEGLETKPVTVNFVYPTLLAISTGCGLVFPFAPDFLTWLFVMTVSWLLFLAIFVLLDERATRFYFIRTSMVTTGARTNGGSVTSSTVPCSARDQELYAVSRASYVLCLACAATWTGLVVFYTVACAAPNYLAPRFPQLTLLTSESLQEVGLCLFEITSKIWYLSVLLDVYEKVFDEMVQAARRLEELRSFMSAVWESSSDVIVFCGRTLMSDGSTRVSVRVSPAYLKMVGLSTGGLPFLNRGDVSLNLEIDVNAKEFHVFAFDLSQPVTRHDVCRLRESLQNGAISFRDKDKLSPHDQVLAVIAELAIQASCQTAPNRCIPHDIFALTNTGVGVIKTPCEAKIAKIDRNSCVLVLRDISDRIQRFEAEKQLIQEMTVRKKDAETNRFSRHEIKNGILAAIALLDHIRESMGRRVAVNGVVSEAGAITASSEETLLDLCRVVGHHTLTALPQFPQSLHECDEEVDEAFSELDSTLRDILDTILDQAMAREIVYGEYEPRKERMNVPEVIHSLRRRTSPRFPLTVEPDPFPEIVLDRQLLRYIYRNAISVSSLVVPPKTW